MGADRAYIGPSLLIVLVYSRRSIRKSLCHSGRQLAFEKIAVVNANLGEALVSVVRMRVYMQMWWIVVIQMHSDHELVSSI